MECRLYSCSNNEHQIIIPDKKKLILGRGPLTKIKEKKCSRSQVELNADYDSREIELKQIGRNPSAIGSTLLKQGDIHLLGPGSVFSFLQGKHSFVVQFFDTCNSQIEEGSLKKNTSSRGLKSTFQTLKRSLSKEYLMNAVKSSPVESSISVDSETTQEMFNGESSKKLQSIETNDAHMSPNKGSKEEHEFKSINGKKRKVNETYENATDMPSKLRKSLSGKLISCVSSEGQEKTDLQDLREEFGDAIVREIEKEQKLPSKNHVSSNSNDAVCNTIENDRPINEKPCAIGENTWISRDGLLVFSGKNLECKGKVACFDLDGTLICTKSGKVFPNGPDDWKLLFGNIKTKFKQLHASNHKIVIFTNQKGLGKWKVSVDGFKQKIENIQALLDVPIQCFVATCDDKFRKPATGMWSGLCNQYNGNEQIDVAKSLYVGDAAGRPANWTKGRKKDFSCADRCFAANIGITFHTPEEFFLNWNKSSFTWPLFNPNSLKKPLSLLHPDCTGAEFSKKTQEVILMVGFPACGKTTVSKDYFVSNGYEHINRDTLGTWQKCVAACKSAVLQGKSVIIDNTNPDKKTRQRYIEVAKSENVPVRCFWMTTSCENSLHNNKFRELTNKDKEYKHVGRIVFNLFKSSFQEPRVEEGFQEVVKVNFVPQFSNKNNENLYFSYLP